MSDRIRVLIADDHPLFRAGLRALLDSIPDTEVVAEAATGEQAVAAAESQLPDVVVMDLGMPGLGGVEATRRITEAGWSRVLVMTMHEDDDAVLAAVRAGARGYVVKGAAQDETLRAIRSVAGGEAIFSPAVAAGLQRVLTTPPDTDPGAFPQLTVREREILALLARRRTNAEIAAELYLSQKTVRNYVSGIFAKLEVADRAEAGLVARAAGLGAP